MRASLDRSGVVAILPEGPLASLALVECLANPARDQLHGTGDLTPALVAHQQVDVIGRDDVIEDAQAIAPAGLIQPLAPKPPVTGELQKEFLLVTAVGSVPDVARQVMTIGSWHGFPPWNGHLGVGIAALRLITGDIKNLTIES